MTKNLSLILIALLCSLQTHSSAYRQFRRNISPDGKANILVCLPESGKATGRAVVICPGGGYEWLAMENEGTNWIPFFTERGIACMILTYRMPHGDLSIPVGDAGKAVSMVRDSAAVWDINPYDVGIMGSSEGGNLPYKLPKHAPQKSLHQLNILF